MFETAGGTELEKWLGTWKEKEIAIFVVMKIICEVVANEFVLY